MGKVSGRPACDLMGGKLTDVLELCALVPLMDAQSMADMAYGWQQAGFITVRLKLGRSPEEDEETVRIVREKLGRGARIRVDYNQAYQPDEAVRAIKAIEPYDIELAEQPVRATDYLGMSYVQQRVDTPLMSHEGCFSLQDIETLIELKAVRVIGINSERPGGVTNALDAVSYSAGHGLGIVIHNQTLGIADAMQIHLAAACRHYLGHAIELFGSVMYEDDLVIDALDFSEGKVRVPAGPGWGVRLDEAVLDKYSVGPRTRLRL